MPSLKTALSEESAESTEPTRSFQVSPERALRIPLALLDPNPFQHRSELDPEALEELSASIASSGLLQPICVRPVGERMQVIAGHRRWEAFKLLLSRAETAPQASLFSTIPAYERGGVTDEEMHRLGLI